VYLDNLTEHIIGACYEVGNELGAGFLETVYENALLIALKDKGINAANQVPLEVKFRDKTVGKYFADVVVENQVIIELKAVKSLASEHIAQILNYLRGTNLPVGLLVNFGNPKIEIRRLENRIRHIHK
jgi:GxxExxY protein